MAKKLKNSKEKDVKPHVDNELEERNSPYVIKDKNNIGQKINKLDGEVIKDIYQELLERFPSQHTVVLMDFAIHLNLLLNINENLIRNIDFGDDGLLTANFPYEFLSKNTKSILQKVFNCLNNTQIGNFIKSAIIQIVDDSDNSKTSVGLLLLVQVCLKMKPGVLIADKKSILDLLTMYRDRTSSLTCCIWVFRQASVNFNIACQIWLIYLLPLIAVKNYTESVIIFGENMMNHAVDNGCNDGVLQLVDFVPLIDTIYNPIIDLYNKKPKKKSVIVPLTQIQMRRLMVIYPKIKNHVLASQTSTASWKEFFISLFVRLTPNNESYTDELLDCLDHCLMSCPDYIRQVDHMYVNYPQQTIIFLTHLQSGNSNVCKMVTKHKSYKTLINKIHATTAAAAVDSKEDKLHQLTKNCRPSTVGGCCSILFRVLMYTLLMGVLVAMMLRYQYPQHYNTIKKNTAPLLDHIVTSITPFMKSVQLRAMELCMASQPIVNQMKVKAVVIWRVSKPYVDLMTTNVHSIALYVYQKADEVAPNVLEQIGQWYIDAGKYITASYNDVLEYLHSPQFQEAVQKVSERSEAVIQQVRLGFNSAVTYTLQMIGY